MDGFHFDILIAHDITCIENSIYVQYIHTFSFFIFLFSYLPSVIVDD